MDIFFEPHRLLMQALIDFDVEFLLVGGYAVNLYGYNRPTGDLDLWLNPTDENKRKLLYMLNQKEFSDESIAYISSLDFSEPEVFSMGEAPLKVDFLTHVNLVKFEAAYKQKNIVEIDGIKYKAPQY